MKINIVPYDPAWKTKYKTESEKIISACRNNILYIEHAGSTSVEGLAAKPIIDIYIGTKSVEEAEAMIEPMIALGYTYRSDYNEKLPFRRYFVKPDEYHVHVTPAYHPFRCSDLRFRDYISINKEARDKYEKCKLELSKIDWPDKFGYTDAKDEICNEIKKESLEFFGRKFEETESAATYLMHKYASAEAMKKASFSLLRKGTLTAIRSDIFPGFSLNRVLGISYIDNDFLDTVEEFYKGKPGKFALQIPPDILTDEKIQLLKSRGYTYSNSWVTFYRDSSPVISRGTDLQIKEINKNQAAEFAYMLSEVFAFPHEFDDIAASSIGENAFVSYMAFDGSKPAGSAGVYIIDDSAYLSFANVLPEYRRRGIQGELLRLRIDAARSRGVKWIFVDTGEDSEENPNPSYWNMLRHGFRLLYHRPNYIKEQ